MKKNKVDFLLRPQYTPYCLKITEQWQIFEKIFKESRFKINFLYGSNLYIGVGGIPDDSKDWWGCGSGVSLLPGP